MQRFALCLSLLFTTACTVSAIDDDSSYTPTNKTKTCPKGTLEGWDGCEVPEPGWIDGPTSAQQTCDSVCADYGYACDPDGEMDLFVTTVSGGMVMTFVDPSGIARSYEGANCSTMPQATKQYSDGLYTLEAYDCACVEGEPLPQEQEEEQEPTPQPTGITCSQRSEGGVGHSCSYAFDGCEGDTSYEVVCRIQNVAGNVFSTCDCLKNNVQQKNVASFDICSTSTWEQTVALVNDLCAWDLSTSLSSGGGGGGGGPSSCGTDCSDLVWSECTCASSDPCGWNNDGVCDLYPVDASCSIFPDHFPDDQDCN